jgi:DNA primase
VVEGYTDVMACHLAGVPTAVATCGTAFGEDHARLLRRLLLDHDEFRGEVIFTFDGDEAGQRAALKAFQGDQQFVSQTYVAVDPDGLDPCELRLAKGDAAVRELVARRLPLYRFVLTHVLSRYDLDRADGRVDAMREGARLVASVRDRSKVDAFARELAGLLGMDVEEVRAEVRRAAGGGAPRREAAQSDEGSARGRVPDLHDSRFAVEREALKVVLQAPALAAADFAAVADEDFTHPGYRSVWQAVQAAGGPGDAGEAWAARVRAYAADERTRALVTELAVEQLPATDPGAQYAKAYVARLRELTTARRIEQVKGRLQRMNPVEQTADYNRLFGELVALEQQRRALRDQAIGGGI